MRSVPANRLTGTPGGLALGDGLSNALTGAGTTVDRRVWDHYTPNFVTQEQIETAYRSSWLVRKVHDLPPFDMTREWRDWQAEDKQIELIEAEERRLGIRLKVQRALTLARLHGGGALFLGLGDANPASAAPANVAQGGLKYVLALSRYHLSYSELETDVLSPFYGQPKMWLMSSAGRQVEIHPSRIIPFISQPKPEGLLAMNWDGDPFWGDPLLMSAGGGLKNAELAENSIAALLDESLIDVIGIPDLIDLVSTKEGEQSLMRRLTVAKTAKSLHRALVKDAEETWEQKSFAFTGLPDVLKLFLQVASGAADIPATRLLGQAPQGMNATGEHDMENYLMMIEAHQATDLGPRLDRLDEVLIPSALGSRPAEIYWTFRPLRKAKPEQLATIEKTKAETAQIYANMGVLPGDALATVVQNKLIESGQWPGIEGALEEAKNDLEIDPVDPGGTEEAGGESGASDRDEPEDDVHRRAANDAAPRTLYVRRNLVNAKEFIAWARSQGFKTTTPADELHVAIAFSREPVDWMKAESTWGPPDGKLTVPAGGARIVEPLGDKGAVALLFNSSELSWRHEQIRRDTGASWDFDSYQPHVTITYQAGGLDLSKVEPFRGALIFGPEIFSEISDDWA